MTATPISERVPYSALVVVETAPDIREEFAEVLALVEETVVATMKDQNLSTKQRRAITRALHTALDEAADLLVADDQPAQPETGGAA